MQKAIQLIIGLMFCSLVHNTLTAQEELSRIGTFLNFNYDNKVRFEWPLGAPQLFNYLSINSVARTSDFVEVLLNNIDEITYETKIDQPLDIDLVKLKNTAQMHIYRNKRPVTYHYKEDKLLFHGFHRIRLSEAGEMDIFIYFDDVEKLNSLRDLNYLELQSEIEHKITKEKVVKRSDINNATDLFFTHADDELLYTGNLGYTSRSSFLVNVIAGPGLYEERLGVNFGVEFLLNRFAVNNYGQNFTKGKAGLELSNTLFNNFNYTYVGLLGLTTPVHRRQNKKSILMGAGFGIWNKYNIETENSIDGFYFSWIVEHNFIRMRFDHHIPFRSRTDEVFSLRVAYMF